jgi:hypothetical protein
MFQSKPEEVQVTVRGETWAELRRIMRNGETVDDALKRLVEAYEEKFQFSGL